MDLVLKNKYKIQGLSEGINLKESIDNIAYTMTVSLIESKELRNIGIKKGNSIELYDYEFQTNNYVKIFDGVVWDINKTSRSKKISLTCKERTVYIEESEDEYLFSEGQTATRRAKQMCSDWGIPIGYFANTNIGLAKAVRRKNSIYSNMLDDLKETAQKGGALYKYRMGTSLDLIEIGSNLTIWKLESILEDFQEQSSLNGVITQVKVLGKTENEDSKSPVIGVYSDKINNYGTIQKIVQDDKVTDGSQAKQRANNMFSDGEESYSLSCIKDINTIRAADKISLNGNYFYVTDIEHQLGSGGKMNLTVMDWEHVKRRFYSGLY